LIERDAVQSPKGKNIKLTASTKWKTAVDRTDLFEVARGKLREDLSSVPLIKQGKLVEVRFGYLCDEIEQLDRWFVMRGYEASQRKDEEEVTQQREAAFSPPVRELPPEPPVQQSEQRASRLSALSPHSENRSSTVAHSDAQSASAVEEQPHREYFRAGS
jgi:hypothetical protein